jgi:hypothetical protein
VREAAREELDAVPRRDAYPRRRRQRAPSRARDPARQEEQAAEEQEPAHPADGDETGGGRPSARAESSYNRGVKQAPKKPAAFSAEERAAMKERAAEQKAARRGAEAEADVVAKIAELGDADRALAERIHALVTTASPDLAPRLWYGMPAYAKDGKVICFFQAAGKFKTRYSTLGFSDKARLDEGTMWPSAYALTELTAADEKRIAALVKRAVG